MLKAAEPRSHRMVARSSEAPSIRRTLAGLHRYRALIRNLVIKDLKLKYRGLLIGFVWSLANPLLTAAVYNVAFRSILTAFDEDRLGNGVARGQQVIAKPLALAADMHDAGQRAEHRQIRIGAGVPAVI